MPLLLPLMEPSFWTVPLLPEMVLMTELKEPLPRESKVMPS